MSKRKERNANGEELTPNFDLKQWIWIKILTQYARMIETDIFLEKWGRAELLQEIIPWLPVIRELTDPDATEEVKIAFRKRKNTLEVGATTQLELSFDGGQKKEFKALALSAYPQFKLKDFFATVSPQLQKYINEKIRELSADEEYHVSEIQLHKDKITFRLHRKR
jgi:hypothetical protein